MIKIKIFKDEKIGDIQPCKTKYTVYPKEKLEFNEFWNYIHNKNKKIKQ
jgi:hypothetical protein